MDRRAAGRQGGVPSVVVTSAIVCFGVCAVGTLVLHGALVGLDWLPAWLAAITTVTFLTYGYDKLVAGTGATRVPEKVLLALACAGGTVGALLGMRLFHHKTSKQSFLERFGLVVAVQAVAIAGWYVFLAPR